MEIKGKVHCSSNKEEWRPISGYERLYEISNLGRVKSLKRWIRANRTGRRIIKSKILSICVNSAGYSIVVLCNNGKKKSHMVHRLVAESFISNPTKYPCVNHKDEDKTNNNVSNLEWCTQEYNANYGTGVAKCSSAKFKPVCMLNDNLEVLHCYESAKNAELETGISRKTISRVCNGKSKSAGGYKWKFNTDYGN